MTGIPKCIVHSAGGTLLQHVKEHRFHADLQDGNILSDYADAERMTYSASHRSAKPTGLETRTMRNADQTE